MQGVTLQLFTASLKFTICSVYLPPHTAVSLADIQDLYSQLPAPLLLLGDFSSRHHLWGSVDEDIRGWVMETLISGRNLVLNTGEPTHTSLASGYLSSLSNAMCSPANFADYTGLSD
jgi:hypothetical protein